MMRYFIWALFLVSVVSVQAKTKKENTASDSPQMVQKFGALSLKGELKRPEINFDKVVLGFEQDSHLQPPENFNDEILDEAKRLKP